MLHAFSIRWDCGSLSTRQTIWASY